MESSSRMRPCLRRNYRGSDHFGEAANHEDDAESKSEQKTLIDPSDAPALSADAITMESVNEDDEQEVDKLEGRASNGDEQSNDQSNFSETTEQAQHVSTESTDIQLASEQDMVQSTSAVAPGYVPSQVDERILLELPSSMVRPLRVVQGTFQVNSWA